MNRRYMPLCDGSRAAAPARPPVLIAAAAGALLLVMSTACSNDRDPGRDLLRQAQAPGRSDSWTYVDRPDAEGLLSCLAGYEAVVVSVSGADDQRMALRREGDTKPVALWSTTESYVAREELTRSGVGWVRIDRANQESREAVTDALGPSLSSYVLAEKLPPSPGELVTSALEFAAHVEVLPAGDGIAETIVRVAVDESRLAQLDAEAVGYPILDFTLADQAVRMIAARPPTEPDSFGFRWEFQQEEIVPAVPPRSVALSEIPDTEPTRAERSCEIGP